MKTIKELEIGDVVYIISKRCPERGIKRLEIGTIVPYYSDGFRYYFTNCWSLSAVVSMSKSNSTTASCKNLQAIISTDLEEIKRVIKESKIIERRKQKVIIDLNYLLKKKIQVQEKIKKLDSLLIIK